MTRAALRRWIAIRRYEHALLWLYTRERWALEVYAHLTRAEHREIRREQGWIA